MKLLIAGSRSIMSYAQVEKYVDLFFGGFIDEVVSGTARGADQLGEKYAKKHKIKIKRFPADWDLYGPRAGYLRNVKMANYCDAAIIFWDGKSPGSENMIEILKEKGIPYKVVRRVNA